MTKKLPDMVSLDGTFVVPGKEVPGFPGSVSWTMSDARVLTDDERTNYFRELGRKGAAGRARKLDRETVRRVKARREAGETLREIAVSLGVSVRTLRRELES